MPLSFDDKLNNYAELAVKIGVGIQAGQRLLIRSPVECAPLARLMARKAYEAGARLVDVLYNDDVLTLTRFTSAPADSFDEVSTWTGDALIKAADRGDAVLSIYATDPDLLKDQDSDRVAQVQKGQQMYQLPFSRRISNKEINWNVIAAPVPSWAAKVFPDEADAEAQLWEAIFRTCRADLPDPVAAWREHAEELARRREYLDGKQYRELRFRGPDTALQVRLPENHRWLGGESHTTGGIPFIANLPTEEVFTLPHREGVTGIVHSTRPLSYAGVLIEDFTLRFEAGRVVGIEAAANGGALEKLIETDEGASRLGEVALVPQSSPIAQSGLLFYNTLYDENASSHLALGRAYRVCLAEGTEMEDEAFKAAGGNDSLAHVDFMIGSTAMDVDGLTGTGETEAVMRGGEWAF